LLGSKSHKAKIYTRMPKAHYCTEHARKVRARLAHNTSCQRPASHKATFYTRMPEAHYCTEHSRQFRVPQTHTPQVASDLPASHKATLYTHCQVLVHSCKEHSRKSRVRLAHTPQATGNAPAATDNLGGIFGEQGGPDKTVVAVYAVPVATQGVDEHQVREGHAV